jgi:hypothetical protein
LESGCRVSAQTAAASAASSRQLDAPAAKAKTGGHSAFEPSLWNAPGAIFDA